MLYNIVNLVKLFLNRAFLKKSVHYFNINLQITINYWSYKANKLCNLY